MQHRMADGSIIICGYVAQDSKFKRVGENKTGFCTFSVKVGERNEEAIWVNCKAWRNAAEYAAQIKKGDSVFAVGKIEVSEYEGKQYKNLVCEFVNIMSAVPVQTPPPAPVQAPKAELDTDFDDFVEILGNDDDTPF